MIGLCDCNNFFVSCERVFRPELRGRAVVVLSGNDGCIIARSNQAKALGIAMGQPLYQVQSIVRANDVTLFSGNMRLYGDMSQRVMNTLTELVPSIEVYSIDEAFLNFDQMAVSTLEDYGRGLASTVSRNTGIPVSIGIAPTKTLAKVASRLCKTYPALHGCCLMYREQDIEKVLKRYSIDDVWGIGRKYAKMLRGYGIDTAYKFTQLSGGWVRAKMGVSGLRTWQELRSQACIEFENTVADKQTICVSRSFSAELSTFEQLNTALSTFTSMACEKLRRQKSVASQMQVFISTNRHRPDAPQSYKSRLVNFDVPTDSTLEMVSEATSALKAILANGFGYKKAGVILSGISPASSVQTALFDSIDRPKHSKLMKTIDTINAHHGRSTIGVAWQGAGNVSDSKHLSPSYTTDWNDIMVVKT